MNADILHSGFDGLKLTIQTDIPPELREKLFQAKLLATKENRDIPVEVNGFALAVRKTGGMAFSASTGDYGAEWYFLDPENRPKNNPGVTVDFRAFLLATGGLRTAQSHFEDGMAALGIPYVETQIKVSRVDFAVDILAPWFEPHHEALVLPPGTRHREFRESDTTQTYGTSATVTGLVAGHVSNRQLAIYDKRTEIITKRKLGWLEIWNHTRQRNRQPPLDLKDRDQSRVWRFEARMGSKRLRRRWEIHGWFELDAMIGDAYAEFLTEIRYTIPNSDRNRSRWPTHELWQAVESAFASDLHKHRSGIVPSRVKDANRAAHKRMLASQSLGLMVSSAVAHDVPPEDFEPFVLRHARLLIELSREHPLPIEDRMGKSAAKYQFR